MPAKKTQDLTADKVLRILCDTNKRPASLKKIADQADVPYPYVKLLARGVIAEPSSRRIERLANALDAIAPGSVRRVQASK